MDNGQDVWPAQVLDVIDYPEFLGLSGNVWMTFRSILLIQKLLMAHLSIPFERNFFQMGTPLLVMGCFHTWIGAMKIG